LTKNRLIMKYSKMTFLFFLLFKCDYSYTQTECIKDMELTLHIKPDSVIDCSLDKNIKFEKAVKKAIGFVDQSLPGQYSQLRMYMHFVVSENGLLDSVIIKASDKYSEGPYEEELRKFFCKIKKIDLSGIPKSGKSTRIILFLKAWQELDQFRLYGTVY